MLNILLVNKYKHEQKEIIHLLKKCFDRCKIFNFTNSEEAQKFITSDCAAIDLLFAEIDMPRVTGFRLAKDLYKYHLGAKVIFISDDRRHALDAWQYKASDYLVKPITIERVIHSVDALHSDF